MNRKAIPSKTVIVSLLATLAIGGCAAEEGATTDDDNNVTNDESELTAAYNTSDFNNLWRLQGTVGFFEGQTTLVLQNVTQPKKPLIRKNIEGGGMGYSSFDADVVLGELTTDEGEMPALGDCIAVKNEGGGRGMTEAELRESREFGAFVYISDPMSGAPKRPAWGVGENRRPKVYKTVDQCLNDKDRSWSNASPTDKLESANDASDYGAYFRLQGAIGGFEGMADIALVNVSDVTEPVILKKSFESGGGVAGIGKLAVTVDIPEDIKPGTCIALKNVSGGRGFTTDETRAKEEFGAFLYAFAGGDGKWHPENATASKVFRTSEACLKDPAALGH